MEFWGKGPIVKQLVANEETSVNVTIINEGNPQQDREFSTLTLDRRELTVVVFFSRLSAS